MMTRADMKRIDKEFERCLAMDLTEILERMDSLELRVSQLELELDRLHEMRGI